MTPAQSLDTNIASLCIIWAVNKNMTFIQLSGTTTDHMYVNCPARIVYSGVREDSSWLYTDLPSPNVLPGLSSEVQLQLNYIQTHPVLTYSLGWAPKSNSLYTDLPSPNCSLGRAPNSNSLTMHHITMNFVIHWRCMLAPLENRAHYSCKFF